MVVPAPEPQADKPHVTVGIPFHSGACAEHLRLAVDSILNQTHRPYRVHLIQDGPVSDDLTALVNDYVARGPHIEHLLIPDNSGLPNALNLSIQQTRSPYYARMDADDISRPDRLEVEARYLEEHPAVDIVGSWAIEFHDDPDEADTFLRKLPTDQPDIARIFHYRSPFVHPSVMFRRSVFDRIGLYDLWWTTAQDYELWARALRHGVGLANIADPLLYLRVNGKVAKRSRLMEIVRQARARYRYNTWSPVSNVLKISAVLFRLMPGPVRQWAYRHLR
jgi:glycosyltransferase involved in cell wall biosynthesis